MKAFFEVYLVVTKPCFSQIHLNSGSQSLENDIFAPDLPWPAVLTVNICSCNKEASAAHSSLSLIQESNEGWWFTQPSAVS